MDWSASIQSVMTFHLEPSHCWNFTLPEPSWSAQVTFRSGMKPSAPRALRRLLSMFKCSRAQRICSPVMTLPLPNFSWARRMASTVTMPCTTPRL